MTRNSSLRERFSHLLCELIDLEHGDGELCNHTGSTDRAVAVRVASHALLNLADEGGSDELHRLAMTLPWMAGFLDWTQSEASPEAMAQKMVTLNMVRHLGPAGLRRRLEQAAYEGQGSVLQRAPRTEPAIHDPQAAALAAIADLDRQLHELVALDDEALRDKLIADSRLLYAAVEICEEGLDSELSLRFQTLFPHWGQAGLSRPLSMLAALEGAPFQRLSVELVELHERARRFEISLTENMSRHGLIAAVRAAMVFGPTQNTTTPGTRRELGQTLRKFSIFDADPALEDLAVAMIEVRWRCFDHLRGALPLSGLNPWISYLRGPCLELAESRNISLREATSFAHYCLHLLNICDLAALGHRMLNTSTRLALMDIEEELKEFALVGQREGLADRQADLGRFECARWAASGEAAYLADRLTRLRGLWRKGTRQGPVGGPASLDMDGVAHSLAVLESLTQSPTEYLLGALASLLRSCHIVGTDWLETLQPIEVMKILGIGLAAARDQPGVDVMRPFCLDLTPLRGWYRGDGATGTHRRILSQLLQRQRLDDLLEVCREPGQPRVGVRAHVIDVANLGQPRVMLDFLATPELQALLALMASSTSEAPQLEAMLEERLLTLLQEGQASKTQLRVSGLAKDAEDTRRDVHLQS